MNVSVIIPLYNAEKYIAKALDSCLQLEEVKEIIVVDDGFKDNAKNIAIDYSTKYSIIKVFSHPNHQNLGAGESRNLGISKATQDYISFLDADDFYLPNRFEKDRLIFQENLDAEGSYNAIEAYFYTENAKEQFLKSFTTTLTTVNIKVNPSHNNLFDGLLGFIPDYGYFHLDGLTLKKSALLKSNIKFSDLRIHQDTVFISQLAYALKIYPSEIIAPVSMRGVHEENRITANNNSSQFIVFKNRALMWKEIMKWAKILDIESRYIEEFEDRYTYFKIRSDDQMNALSFILEILKKPRILKNSNYLILHRAYFKNHDISFLIFKLRNLIVKLI